MSIRSVFPECRWATEVVVEGGRGEERGWVRRKGMNRGGGGGGMCALSPEVVLKGRCMKETRWLPWSEFCQWTCFLATPSYCVAATPCANFTLLAANDAQGRVLYRCTALHALGSCILLPCTLNPLLYNASIITGHTHFLTYSKCSLIVFSHSRHMREFQRQNWH